MACKARFTASGDLWIRAERRTRKLRFVLAGLAVALVTVAPAASAPNAPQARWALGMARPFPFSPSSRGTRCAGPPSTTSCSRPTQLFNSPVYSLLGTKNTRATPDTTVPNGTYWWRVQAVDANGNTSPLVGRRARSKSSGPTRPTLTSPDDGAVISFPDEPLVLRWDPVPGAAKYSVEIANDLGLSSLVTSGGNPVVIQATNLAPALLLPSNMYFWAVTPLDAKGNPASRPRSAHSPGTGRRRPRRQVTDLAAETELYDPEFTWDPVPGAARYEVEVNSSSDFAVRSRRSAATRQADRNDTVARSEVFVNNTYYWRVRAINAQDEAGVWNEGPSFDKTFDNYPAPGRARDQEPAHAGHASIRETTRAGIPATRPTSDRHLGSRAWSLELPGQGRCRTTTHYRNTVTSEPHLRLSRWLVKTASTSLDAAGRRQPDEHAVPFEPQRRVEGRADARSPAAPTASSVQARSGRREPFSARSGATSTYLDDGTGASFTFTRLPERRSLLPRLQRRLPRRGRLPAPDSRRDSPAPTRCFIWNPIAGKQSYWVIVAKDPSFTTIIDYGFTRIPAYAVRTQSQPRTYPDETTSYYWVVLPATGHRRQSAAGNVPSQGGYADFEKQIGAADAPRA